MPGHIGFRYVFILLLFALALRGKTVSIFAQTCGADSLTTSPGLFSTSCTASNLTTNDTIYAAFDYKKQSSTVSWAGINATYYVSSVTDCGSISSVQLCYDWWTSNTQTGDCYMNVTNAATGSVSFNTTCPPTTNQTGIVCSNVTASESWTCSNFFNSTGTHAGIFSLCTFRPLFPVFPPLRPNVFLLRPHYDVRCRYV